MIAVIDYGMGNIHSVIKAIEAFGQPARVAVAKEDLEKAEKIVLPGVGGFADAMRELKKRGLEAAIIAVIKKKKPFLGICLGMQLLFEASEESEGAKGLGILKGKVVRFKVSANLKIPHIGWNQLRHVTKSPLRLRSGQASHQVTSDCSLLKDIPDNSYVYFCHSYYAVPKDESIAAARTDYGPDFVSVVCKDNLFGIQFHPEKSQSVGLKILENFINLC